MLVDNHSEFSPFNQMGFVCLFVCSVLFCFCFLLIVHYGKHTKRMMQALQMSGYVRKPTWGEVSKL